MVVVMEDLTVQMHKLMEILAPTIQMDQLVLVQVVVLTKALVVMLVLVDLLH
jgi:hypothetical protein|tara:strand:+ start:107 stop:262 length:156 start_codon:yes stop_codon:yes gene_type:complete